jgi:hypothetical protein
MTLGAWETSNDPASLAELNNARRERDARAAESRRITTALKNLQQQLRANLRRLVAIRNAAEADLRQERNVDVALDALVDTIHPKRRAEAACALMAHVRPEDCRRFALDANALECAVDQVLLTGWIHGDGNHWHEVGL